MRRFTLDSESCELLIAFEELGNLNAVAIDLRKDPTVVLRQLQKISGRAPVLEKLAGRWKLSPLGRELVQWAHDAIESQARLFKGPTHLTIATTSEFSARILSPQIAKILTGTGRTFRILTDGSSSEKHLLAGRADIAIECGRPADPLIRFRLILDEPFSIVATPEFVKKNKIRDGNSLITSDHIGYERDPATQLLSLEESSLHMVANFGDISSTREACLAGAGWAVLPNYATAAWVASHKLVQLTHLKVLSRKFGLWWHRDRKSIRPTIDAIADWLRDQDLS